MKSLKKVQFLSYFLAIMLPLISCQKSEVTPVDQVVPATSISAESLSTLETTSTQRKRTAPFFDAALNTTKSLIAYTQTSIATTAMVINSSRISIVSDPKYGSRRKVMLMDVRPQDTGGLTANPRAQVQTPMQYTEGQDVYVGFSVYFPQTIWTYFLTFSELYGAPYIGSSPFRLAIQESNIIVDCNGKTKYKEPMQAGIWYDFVYHEVLSKNASVGKAEVKMRKQGESGFTEILPETSMATITASNFLGPQYHKLACYYDKNNTYTDATKRTHVSEVKVYFTNHKVGSSFAQVAPPRM